MRLPRVSKIYLQFLLALTLIAVIPLTIVGLGIATLDRQTLVEQSARELSGIASALVGELNVKLDGLLRDAETIASLPSITSMDPDRQERVLKELFLHNDQFSALDVLSPDGQLLASSHPNRQPVIDSLAFDTASTNGLQSWSISIDPNNNQRILLIYAPIRNADRQVSGVLAGVVNLRDLSAMVRKVQVGSSRAFVLDSAGQVLLHPNNEMMQQASSGPWQAAFDRQELVGTGTTSYLIDGEIFDAGFASLSDFNWTILVERPDAEVVASAQRAYYFTLVAVLLTAGAAFVTALWLAGRLTRPIRLLAEAARAFAQGDSSLPLPQKFKQDSELGVLVSAFADMREAVTKREAALRQSESQNRAILNAIPDIILQVNADGRLLACKTAAEDGFPLFSVEAVGKTLPQICPEEFAQKALHMVRQTLQQPGQSHQLECQLPTPGDEVNDYEARFAVSGPNEVLIMVRNITAQRQAEEQLRLMRSVVLNTTESVLITAAGPIDKPGPRIVYVNEAFTDMTGYRAEEVIGLNPRILQGPRTDRAQLDKIRAALTRWQPVRVELINYRKDGSEFWVDFSIAPLKDEKGQVTHFVSVQRDVTDRKQAEAELQRAKDALVAERASLAQRVEARTAELSAANAELARAARLKDEFLAAMSHELRTPLNAILGMAEALQEQVFGPLNADQLDSLHEVSASGRHLLELITDILDLSKIGAGRMELATEPVSIKNVCQASLRMVKQPAHDKQIKIMSTIDQAATTILADERRLKQILVNLLSNAVKFTPAGGQVGLEAIVNESRECIDFTVWDTGIGIAQEDMAQLFQAFVQLDSRLSRRYEGTGLGLALVYRLAELHGGSITVDSEPGQGSRFTVSLPWAEALESTPAKEKTHRAIEPANKLKPLSGESNAASPLILLAEDNEANIRTVSRYLQRRGYQLIVARNGVEAIGRAKQDRPALILMDIQMPEMDGLQAIGRLRADLDFAHVPIIALTALAMPGDRERCLAAGADAYLSKPVSLGHLVREIEAQLKLPAAV